ncbi:hypothetical protein [uncultured Croceitalea sp.]|uniref:hypothetical protein n=1 Tax=uncultured Croceitalea sp. TaxID=1798908 RepID=UPI003305D971
MLATIKSYFKRGPRIYGIEVFDENGTLHFEVLEVNMVKDELFIYNRFSVTNWNELFLQLDVKIPICLSYNTQSVLHKTFSKVNTFESSALIEREFPSLDLDRFYFNLVPFGDSLYLGLSEKDKVAIVLKAFEDAKFAIIDFTLGIAGLHSMFDFLKTENIHTRTKRLVHISDGTNDEISIQSKKDTDVNPDYDINGVQLRGSSLVCFGSVVSQLNTANFVEHNYETLLKSLAEKFGYSRAFRVLLWPVIGFFIALLLVNFFFFDHYYGAYTDLKVTLDSNSANKEKLLALKENVLRKEKRVEAILANNNSKSTLFLDDIAMSAPNSVVLDNMNFQPLSKPIRDGKVIEQDYKIVVLSGETNDPNEFSNWIATLEKFAWVAQVETLSYGFKNTKSSAFGLKITVNEK